jgi:peptidyl-prolyl cis-trans isomerase C
MNRTTWAVATAGAMLASFGCGSKTGGSSSATSSTAAKTGDVVAHVGNDVITADEVKARLGEQAPFLRARYEAPAQKKEFVENMVKFEILSQEAIKKGLDKTPEAQSQFKRMLVQELIKNYYDQKVDVSDEDLKKYYDKHIDDYVKPEKVRVQHIFLAAPEGTDAKSKAARAEAKAKAARFEAKLKADQAAAAKQATPLPPSSPLPAMSELAKQESSDAQSKNVGGDLRFLSQDDLSKQFSAEFAKAAFALTTDAPLSGVIETPKGFHIARLLGRQAATNQPFDDAKFKSTLKDRYLAETRSQRFDEYYQELKKAANVSIDEKALAAVEVPNTPAKAGAPGMPGVGTMPHAAPPPGMTAGGAPHPPFGSTPNLRPPPPRPTPVAAGANH